MKAIITMLLICFMVSTGRAAAQLQDSTTVTYQKKKKKPAKKATYFIQCQAITKKGYQCSRKARGNGYCWQHGG